MELPNLGINCHAENCNTLDFLPVKCDGCSGIFCKNHYPYNLHRCPLSYTLQNQVPVCPLCGTVIPVKPGELPDEHVGKHIDTACQSRPDLQLKGKIFSNACSAPRCKKKELIPFQCPGCSLNYCVSHRNELDHNCTDIRQSNANFQKPSPLPSGSHSLLTDLPRSAQEEQHQLELAVKASLQDKPQSRSTGRDKNPSKDCRLM